MQNADVMLTREDNNSKYTQWKELLMDLKTQHLIITSSKAALCNT